MYLKCSVTNNRKHTFGMKDVTKQRNVENTLIKSENIAIFKNMTK